MSPEKELLCMAQRFISGEDRSMEFVTAMENFTSECLLDSEMFEFLTDAFSLYRPWAGAPYWSEEDMVRLLREFVAEFGGPSTA